MKKRVLSFLLAFCMMISLLSGVALAADPVITLTGGEIQKGSTLVVPVTIANNPTIGAANIHIVYDETALKLDAINGYYFDQANPAAGMQMGMMSLVGNPAANAIAYAEATGISTDGGLFWLTFSVAETAVNGDYSVTLEKLPNTSALFIGTDGSHLDIAIEPATVTVKGAAAPAAKKAALSVAASENGTIALPVTEAEYGASVTATATPAEGYEFSHLLVNGEAVEGLTFTVPEADTVTVQGVFVEFGPAIVASGECGENLTWTLDDAGVLTISGTGTMTDYAHEAGGYAPWYTSCEEIQAVQLPEGITTIGSYAFYQCKNIQNVLLPYGVNAIGASAFEGCHTLESIDIPSTVTNIEDCAFSSCDALVGIELPEGLDRIASGLFMGCAKLETVNIPSSVRLIDKSAFYGCKSVRSFALPYGLTKIEYAAFDSCEALTEIVIPVSVTYIGGSAFNQCRNMEKITIPNTVTTLGSSVFSACYALTSIELPSQIKTIGSSLFYACTGLTEIVIPEGVTTISARAFFGCTGLKKIVLPGSVTTIESYAFQNCTSLSDVYYGGSVKQKEKISVGANCTYIENAVWHCSAASLSVIASENGTITLPAAEAEYGASVTATAAPAEGYEFSHLLVNGEQVDSLTFTIPEAETVTVQGVFKKSPVANYLFEVTNGDDVQNVETVAEMTALVNANGKTKIKLLKDLVNNTASSGAGTISVPYTCELDLNGHTISVLDGNPWMIAAAGTENIVSVVKNGTILALDRRMAGMSAIRVYGGALRVEDVIAYAPNGMTVANYVTDPQYNDDNLITDCTLVSGNFLPDADGSDPTAPAARGWAAFGYNKTGGAQNSISTKIENSVLIAAKPTGADALAYRTAGCSVVLGSNVDVYTYHTRLANSGLTFSGNALSKDETKTYTIAVPAGIPAKGTDSAVLTEYTGLTCYSTEADSAKKASLSVAASENGTITLPAAEAEYGASVTATATPAEGYEFSHLLVNGVKVDSLTFTVPEAETVTVQGVFKKTAVTPDAPPADAIASIVTGDTTVYATTVADMLAAVDATGNSVITLYKDITSDASVGVPYTCTLDLNGHKISTTASNAWDVKAVGSESKVVTVKNGTIDGAMSALCWRVGALVVDNCTLIGRGSAAIQILNHKKADPNAADYSAQNIIKNSTVYSSIWIAVSFNSTNNDFTDVSLKFENCDLIAAKTNVVLSNQGKETKPGTYVLGKNVNMYTLGTAYAKTTVPAPTVTGETVYKANGTFDVTVDGTTLSGLNKWTTDAVATPQKAALTVAASENGTIMLPVTEAVCGTAVTVTATPAEGYGFSHLLVNGVKVEGLTFTVPEAETVTVQGVFEKKAPTVIASGTCGDDLTWVLTDTDANGTGETLTISGSGKMADYTSVTSGAAPWYKYRGVIKKVIVEEGVTAIGSYAFNSCSYMTAVTIPGSVTTIGSYAFRSCNGLTVVDLPASLVSIENYAFSNCTKLVRITIPASVTAIGSYAFGSCSSLKEILVAEENEVYSDKGGVLLSGDGQTLIHYPIGKAETTYVIPEGVTTIGTGAFSGSTKLTAITIPEGVRNINGSAFSNCIKLTEMKLPASVAFVGSRAFGACSVLGGITVAEGNEAYCAKDGVLLSKDEKTLVAYPMGKTWTTYAIPDTVAAISDYTFYGCTGLTQIAIPEGVTSIGNYAFYGCTGLTQLAIPEGVTSIGNYAFYGCSGLTEITLPAGISEIASNVFNGCTGLTQIAVPEGVTSIGISAFYRCTKLAKVSLPGTLSSVGNGAFNSCGTLTEVYYNGTESQKADVTVGTNNSALLNALWHYAAGVPITVTVSGNGMVTNAPQSAAMGTTVTLTVTNETGHVFSHITVNGVRIDGLTFTVPQDDSVAVVVVFEVLSAENAIATVTNGTETVYVGTVAEMLAAIDPSGRSVVTLLKDVSSDAAIAVPYTCTLDLNGHKLSTTKSNAWDVKAAGTENQITTIKNGTIDGAMAAVCWRNGALVVDNCTLIGRGSLAVQILNHKNSVPDAAAYKGQSIIRNSTLASTIWSTLGFNSTNNDFTDSDLTIENCVLYAAKTNANLSNQTKGTIPGTFILGKGVSFYTLGTSYVKTSAPAPTVTGEPVFQAPGTYSLTIDGVTYEGLNKFYTLKEGETIPKKAALSVAASENGTVTLPVTEAEYGTKITATATPAVGYEFSHLLVGGVKVEGLTFTVPEAETVTVRGVFKKIVDSTAFTIEGGTVTAGAGESVVLPIMLRNNPGLAGIAFKLKYAEGLTVTKIVRGNAVPELDFVKPGNLAANPLTISLDGIDADSTNGTLVEITLQVSAEALPGDALTVELIEIPSSIYDGNMDDVEAVLLAGTVNVRKRDVSHCISFEDSTVTYNGAEHTQATAAMTDASLTGSITYTYEGDRRNAGTFTVTATYEDARNIGTKTVSVTIHPAVLTVSTVRGQDKVYDGTNAGTFAATLAGIVEGDKVPFTVQAAFGGKDVGTNKNLIGSVILDEGVKNYVLSEKDALIYTTASILPKEVTPTLTAENVVFNGAEQKSGSVTFAGAVAGETLTEGIDYTVSYENNVNAGTARFTVSSVTGSNYTFAEASKTFVITKAAAPTLNVEGAVEYMFTDRGEKTVTILGLPANAGAADYRLGNVADADNVFSKVSVSADGVVSFNLSGMSTFRTGVSATIPVTVTSANYEDASVLVVITIRTVPGDINGDGDVTNKDVTVLRRYISGGYNVTDYIEAALDVNHDGDVTNKDVTVLRRFISGGYGVELN